VEEAIFSECDAGLLKQSLCAPGLSQNEKLIRAVEVPFNPACFDDNVLFFVFTGLQLSHLCESYGHKHICEHGCVQES